MTPSSVVYVDLRKDNDGREKHMDDGGTEQSNFTRWLRSKKTVILIVYQAQFTEGDTLELGPEMTLFVFFFAFCFVYY